MIYNDILKNETEKVIPAFSVDAVLKNFTYEDLKTAEPSEYGTILTAVLKNLSLTQTDLAELTGLGSASISRVCNNKTNPRKSTMKKIIDTLSELDPDCKKEAALEQKYEEKEVVVDDTIDTGWELAKEIAALGYGMREKIYGVGDMEKLMLNTPMKSAKRIYENYRKDLIKPGVIALYKDTIKCLVVKVDRNFATIFIPETGLSKEVPVLNLKKTAEKLNI